MSPITPRSAFRYTGTRNVEHQNRGAMFNKEVWLGKLMG